MDLLAFESKTNKYDPAGHICLFLEKNALSPRGHEAAIVTNLQRTMNRVGSRKLKAWVIFCYSVAAWTVGSSVFSLKKIENQLFDGLKGRLIITVNTVQAHFVREDDTTPSVFDTGQMLVLTLPPLFDTGWMLVLTLVGYCIWNG